MLVHWNLEIRVFEVRHILGNSLLELFSCRLLVSRELVINEASVNVKVFLVQQSLELEQFSACINFFWSDLLGHPLRMGDHLLLALTLCRIE